MNEEVSLYLARRNDTTTLPAPSTVAAATCARAGWARLIGCVADAVHGAACLLLAVAAVIRFGSIFDVLDGIVVPISQALLKQAWLGFRDCFHE